MKKSLTPLAVLLLTFLFCTDIQGAGFALYEYSARTLAMGGATVANKAEPASLATNPALITELEGTQAQLGLTTVSVAARTTYDYGTASASSRAIKPDTFFLPHFYVTQKWSNDITFGLGGFSRYGAGVRYNDWQTWPGSQLAYKVKVETFSFTPTLAIKANDQFSVAMGLEAMLIGFSQNATLTTAYGPLFAEQNAYEISGSGVSWGGNFSFVYKPEWAEKWALGAMYRTKVKQNVKGRIHYDGTIVSPIQAGDAIGSIALPDSITAGLSFQATDNWTLEAGIVGTFWSSYDQITIEYTDNESAPTIHNRKNYKDVYRLNFGTEYALNEHWALRAGYVYDKSPINEHAMDTLVPVDDRHIASLGVGYKADRWKLDFGYAHLFSRTLCGTTNAQAGSKPMRYSDGKSEMFSLTFGYKF